MAFRFEECEWCVFHGVEPGICEECEDASEYEPVEDEDSMAAKTQPIEFLKKAA